MTDFIDVVYQELKERKIHPSGRFDSAGRFYLDHADLVDVRSPSRTYPYSQMRAGRTKKYVRAVAATYKCSTASELRRWI